MAEATVVPETSSSAAKLDSLLQIRQEFDVTSDFVEAAVKSTSRTGDLVEVLLRRRPNSIVITENVMKALDHRRKPKHWIPCYENEQKTL
ncbi:hypothetical protein COL516b_005709 [Colletotrichum fioriniae]|nr:uncharacterized protein COL516b_005709 [Colletotrichum fioriniae]KAJ0304926.1 hypothetical protein COL516b_005709 [Colletotrichum fioriniae]